MDRPTKTRPDPIFFANPSEFHKWLEENHDKASEIWVGFHKKGSGKPTITMRESVDEALCFGWIDSIRKGVNDTSYTNRFTKRKTRSNWSAINIRRAKELINLGRMQPAGLIAFEQRSDDRSAILLLRAERDRKVERSLRKAVSCQQESVEFLPSPSSMVPESGNVLGGQCEER